VASAIALAGDASTATLLVAGVAGLSGTGLGLALRGYLRPLGEMASPNGWWLVLAIVVGGLLFAAPNGVQLVTVSLLAGFLLACCLVVGRRELALRRRSSV
jgi:hypothetical protein